MPVWVVAAAGREWKYPPDGPQRRYTDRQRGVGRARQELGLCHGRSLWFDISMIRTWYSGIYVGRRWINPGRSHVDVPTALRVVREDLWADTARAMFPRHRSPPRRPRIHRGSRRPPAGPSSFFGICQHRGHPRVDCAGPSLATDTGTPFGASVAAQQPPCVRLSAPPALESATRIP